MSMGTTMTLAAVVCVWGLAAFDAAPSAARHLIDAEADDAAPATLAQGRNQSVRVSTIVLRVEKIERSTRALLGRGPGGQPQAVTVAPDVTIFDELEVGDEIVIDYIDAVVVDLTPGAALTLVDETTAHAKAQVTDPLVKVDQQLTAVVTIDEVDRAAGTVVYRTKDSRRVLRAVQDPALLDGLRPGDVVTITLTRERAVSVRRTAK